MKLKLATLLLISVAALLGAKHIKPSPGGWILYSHLGEIKLTDLSPGVAFDFPVSPQPDPNATGDWAEYLIETHTAALPGGGFLTATFTVSTSTPSPVFNFMSAPFNTCGGSPPAIRLYFQSGQLWNAAGYNRWWSNSRVGDPSVKYILGPGTATLTVPLTPDHWSETFGNFGDSSATATNGFNSTVARPTYWGATMGGGCFFGHGVNISNGTARLAMTNYSAF